MSNCNYSGLVVNWMTEDRTIRAIESVRNYYPDLHIFIVDDGTRASSYGDFMEFYRADEYRPDIIFDPGIERLKAVPNATFIELNHHISHGAAIDYAIPMMKENQWLFHFDSDLRLISHGVIDYCLGKVIDSDCQVGNQKIQDDAYPHIANYCMMFRPDLAWRYSASFKPIYHLRLEAGHRYAHTLIQEGFTIKYLDLTPFYVHLRWGNEEQRSLWKQYY